jgi:alpha-ketoglutarate-dependent taurine dioxygenase
MSPEQPHFAAEVVGLQPTLAVGGGAPTEAVGAALRVLLAERKVLCLRFAAPLDDDETFMAVVRLFGPLHVKGGRDKAGDFFEYSKQVGRNDNSKGLHTGENHGANFYHTDTCFVDAPPMCTVLHARVLPPSGGGDTGFLDAAAAYALLPAADKAALEGVRGAGGGGEGGGSPSTRSGL